jgi:hypothetical protein
MDMINVYQVSVGKGIEKDVLRYRQRDIRMCNKGKGYGVCAFSSVCQDRMEFCENSNKLLDSRRTEKFLTSDQISKETMHHCYNTVWNTYL